MQALEPANEQSYERAGIWDLQTRQKLDFLGIQLLMSETRNGPSRNSHSSFGVEQKTVVVIELRHFGDLPEGFAETVAQRAYDYAASQGVHMRGSDAKAAVSGYSLPVRSM